MKYVLITPARNESAFIKTTMDSVCAQTLLPERWVIVDDGSTDGMAEIVEDYAERHSWIELVRRPQRQDRNFAGKVHAFNAGFERVRTLDFEVVGNLDGDVSFAPDYLEFLMEKFSQDKRLGVAGTPFTQDGGYDSTKNSFEGDQYVAGPCQLFRAKCWQDVGGYVPNRGGGVDWIAVTTARMKGWKVQSFPEKRFHHHRSMGTAEKGMAAACFTYGYRAYCLGWSPVWQLVRSAYRMTKKPILIGGVALWLGYCWAALKRAYRPVSPELIRFHRGEQQERLKSIFRSLVRFKKVDSFHVATEEPKSS
jgi:glycosyltransferase involved in cell wall biosynthesis